MSEQQGRQSPPPSQQTGAQMHETVASGQGVDKAENKEKTNEEALKNLSSNPKGPLDDAAKDKVSKAIP